MNQWGDQHLFDIDPVENQEEENDSAPLSRMKVIDRLWSTDVWRRQLHLHHRCLCLCGDQHWIEWNNFFRQHSSNRKWKKGSLVNSWIYCSIPCANRLLPMANNFLEIAQCVDSIFSHRDLDNDQTSIHLLCSPWMIMPGYVSEVMLTDEAPPMSIDEIDSLRSSERQEKFREILFVRTKSVWWVNRMVSLLWRWT